MTKLNEDFDEERYNTDNLLRNSPAPDKQPLQGAYFPQPEVKQQWVSRRVLAYLSVIAACFVLSFMIAAAIIATT